MNPELIDLVSRTAVSTSPMSSPAVAAASASLLGITAFALMVQNTLVRVTNPYPAVAEVRGGVQGYIDATTDGVRHVLGDASQGMGAEDEETLPTRFGQVGDATPAAIRELADAARDDAVALSVRRAAIIGLGVFSAGDPATVRELIRELLADPNVGIAEGALRAVDWGSVAGLDAELRALAADSRRPTWLRSYAADLAG